MTDASFSAIVAIVIAVATNGIIAWLKRSFLPNRQLWGIEAAVVAILICVSFGVDLLASLRPSFDAIVGVSWFGSVITGFALGRLANLIHDASSALLYLIQSIVRAQRGADKES